VKPTTEGVSREPEELIKTFGDEPSITATTEIVVPRSIPIILAISNFLSLFIGLCHYVKSSPYECAKPVPVGGLACIEPLKLFNYKNLSFISAFFRFLVC
jgi:hypothetical protein